MDLHAFIDRYAAYDLWANTRFAERLSREPENVIDAPLRSSFPSLRATLMHMRNAENAWRQRSLGEAQRWPAEESDDLSTFLKHVTGMRDHVRGLDTRALLEVVTYKDLRGNEHRQPRHDMFMHCFNHSTYHRGQLVTMMRELGLEEIPASDLVVFQRLGGKN